MSSLPHVVVAPLGVQYGGAIEVRAGAMAKVTSTVFEQNEAKTCAPFHRPPTIDTPLLLAFVMCDSPRSIAMQRHMSRRPTSRIRILPPRAGCRTDVPLADVVTLAGHAGWRHVCYDGVDGQNHRYSIRTERGRKGLHNRPRAYSPIQWPVTRPRHACSTCWWRGPPPYVLRARCLDM